MKIITNTDNLTKYKIYIDVKKSVIDFLNKKNYLEVDLPILSPSLIPESYLEVFETDFRYLSQKEKLYLTPSPELFLKRLLSYGIKDCFYLGKSFRNSDPSSTLHSFEFMMLEFYKTKTDYWGIADELLEMLGYVSRHLSADKSGAGKSKTITYQGQKISLGQWEKISVADAFEKYAGIKEKELFDQKAFINKAEKKGYRSKGFGYEDLWSQIYTSEIEPNLGVNGYPTLIYDYPKEFAALAKLNPDGKTSQRFEFYVAGIELGDCYTELTDWKEQSIRFEQEDIKRKKAGKTGHTVDKGFIEALKYGLVDCSGVAVGFERLAMIFADARSIKEIKLIDIE
ncbi:hypothetical protein GYA28_04715 [Candidatus Roizmanbacteria bacterium]|jgi:elongation factor P--beta-lysine ligase|nr:hypothetical protein [Candidatus Roizmanbacteria bacterium]